MRLLGGEEISFRMLNGTMTCVFYETWDSLVCRSQGETHLYPFPFLFFSEFALFLYVSFGLLCFCIRRRGVVLGDWVEGDWRCGGIVRERNALDERCTLLLPILFASCFSFCSVLALVCSCTREGFLAWVTLVQVPLTVLFYRVCRLVPRDLFHDVMKRGTGEKRGVCGLVMVFSGRVEGIFFRGANGKDWFSLCAGPV